MMGANLGGKLWVGKVQKNTRFIWGASEIDQFDLGLKKCVGKSRDRFGVFFLCVGISLFSWEIFACGRAIVVRTALSHRRSRHLFQPKICLSLCKAVGSPSIGHGDVRWVVQILMHMKEWMTIKSGIRRYK